MIVILYFLAGLTVGFFVTFTFLRNDKKYKALEENLQAKTSELENYQTQVTEHFTQTTKLLTDLQLQQDKFIAHLADGAARLRYDMLDPVSELAIKGPISYAPKDYPEAPPEDAKTNDA
jgi:uncharacterized membrane-anchored protein YhcB (DUF1043 family)